MIHPQSQAAPPDRTRLRSRLDLAQLLEGAAQSFPNRLAFGDTANRISLDGQQPKNLTLGDLRREAERIAGLFAQFRLPTGSSVLVQLPNVPEAPLVLLASLRAGLCPVIVPLTAGRAALAAAAEASRCDVAVTVTHAAGTEPAAVMRDVAAGYFGLRFVAAFGNDVPDGMIGLDRLPWALADQAAPSAREHGPDYGLVATLDQASGELQARSCESLIGTGLSIVAAARMRPGQRVVSTLPPDDLAGLATSVVPALAAGIPVTMMALFDSIVLRATLDQGQPTHLVIPSWLEPLFARSPLAAHPSLAGVVVVHTLPYDRREHDFGLAAPVVDVLSIGEHALFVSNRPIGSGPRFSLSAAAPRLPSGHALIEAREESGWLELRGRAGRARPLPPRGEREPDYAMPSDRWQAVPIAVIAEADEIVAMRRA